VTPVAAESESESELVGTRWRVLAPLLLWLVVGLVVRLRLASGKIVFKNANIHCLHLEISLESRPPQKFETPTNRFVYVPQTVALQLHRDVKRETVHVLQWKQLVSKNNQHFPVRNPSEMQTLEDKKQMLEASTHRRREAATSAAAHRSPYPVTAATVITSNFSGA
jgi:hypothetical protein